MKTKQKEKGRFIVIDGTDGSGKATQTELLVKRLKQDGLKVEMADFPQYGKPSAYFVEKYLRGEYGGSEDVGPYKASVFYALDRYDKSAEIKKWLDEGKMVVANRYVSSNIGHQAGKISNKKERGKFLKWLLNFEYELFAIPQPDMVVLLFMPPRIGQMLVDKKNAREYIKGKKRDIHEADIKHLKNASKAYLAMAKNHSWSVIECGQDEGPRVIKDIHEDLYKIVKSLI